MTWLESISSCQQAGLLTEKQLDEPLTRRERWILKLHLVMCSACRQGHLYATRLRAWMRGETFAESPLSEDARRRIGRAVHEEMRRLESPLD